MPVICRPITPQAFHCYLNSFFGGGRSLLASGRVHYIMLTSHSLNSYTIPEAARPRAEFSRHLDPNSRSKTCHSFHSAHAWEMCGILHLRNKYAGRIPWSWSEPGSCRYYPACWPLLLLSHPTYEEDKSVQHHVLVFMAQGHFQHASYRFQRT